MNKKFEKFLSRKIFRRRLWEGLSVACASLLVITTGGFYIADSQSAAINHALNISGSEIERSDEEQYQYFKSDYTADEYAKLQQDYLEACEQIEGEGLVLLKNENDALPLSDAEKVSCFLTGSVSFNYATSGSSEADTSGYTELKTALENEGLSVNAELWDFYKDKTSEEGGYGRYMTGTIYLVNEVPYDEYGSVTSTFGEYSTAIVNIARDSGEGKDLTAYSGAAAYAEELGEDKSCLSLTSREVEVLEQLTQLKKAGTVKKIVVLLNSSATIQLDFLYKDTIDVDACLWVGNVGKSGISAVAKALTGKIVPSGKLSDTYLKNNFSSPAMMQQSYNDNKRFMSAYENGDGLEDNSQKYYGVYSEGIYVGYRYYETRYTDYVNGTGNAGEYDYSADVAYPFGYGISYADFRYTAFDVAESEDGESFDVTVTVRNDSDTYGGKEAVCVYLQKPYIAGGVEKSAVELAGYAKTGVIRPGGEETVTISVEKERFKSYDADVAETYVVDAGEYYLAVGNGSHEAANNILAAQGKTAENTGGRMDCDGNAGLAKMVWDNPETDRTTYSVSAHTGKEIVNQLEFADLNKYEGSDTEVTYVSRNDWTGTLPKGKITVAVTDEMYRDLQRKKPVPEDPDAKMPSYGKYVGKGLTLAMLRGKDYDAPEWEQLLDQMTFEEQSYLLTNGMYTTVAVASVAKPDTADYDGPTGVVGSKGGLSMPSEGIWASSFNNELIGRVGEMLAEDARALGYSALYANAINLHRMPFGGRSHEYFSEDPYLTAMAGVSEIRGIQSKGVIANVKHIAFNDQEDQRSGGGIWLNEQAAREIYLLPFEYALSSAEGMGNAHAVMSAMNRIGTDWVGANMNLLNNIMRDEWGFDGYCITDMAASDTGYIMNYQDGIARGTDLFLGSGSKTALAEFRNNASFCQRMREASHRILYSVCNYSAAMNGITPDTMVNIADAWWRVTIIAVDCTFGVLTAGTAAMYVLCLVKQYGIKKEEND